MPAQRLEIWRALARRCIPTPERVPLLQLVRDRWSIQRALNLLRLWGFQSIRTGMQTVLQDITSLLAMVR